MLRGQSLGLRQLERRFNEIVGLPPKRLARIIRFQSALGSIYSNPDRELTGIAYDHGYSDQAHFIHECKALSGKAPSIVRREAAEELPPEFDVEFLQSTADGRVESRESTIEGQPDYKNWNGGGVCRITSPRRILRQRRSGSK